MDEGVPTTMVEVDTHSRIRLHEIPPDSQLLHREILRGLGKNPKELPSKLFYDQHGSALFERICELEEYYLTRIEAGILRRKAVEIAAAIGSHVLLIELGSGNSTKTRILLGHLDEPAAYMPIDLSREQLQRSAAAIASSYPQLEVVPLHADYTQRLSLPQVDSDFSQIVCFFPGSTIGNFRPGEAVEFLLRMRHLLGPAGGMLIGADLKKDPAVLHLAYNDHAGVTAEFNLNILAHVNRLTGSDFQLQRFRHQAHYDPRHGRIEMHLISQVGQQVHLLGSTISLQAGEPILTEVSYKYDLPQFARLACQAGFDVKQTWTDERQYFSLQMLRPTR